MGQNRDLSRFPNAITVLDNGNVGMGTTSPTYKLDVSGNIRLSGAYGSLNGLYLSGTTYAMIGVDRGASSASAGMSYFSAGGQKWFTGIYENTDNFGFYNALLSTFPMIITSAGNVGINTGTPRALFDVRCNADRGFRVSSPGVSTEIVIACYQGDVSNNIRSLRISGDNIYFNTGNGSDSTGTERMKITDSGRLELKTEGFVSQKGASNTVGGGSFIGLQQTTGGGGERWMLQQLNSSYGLDYWAYNGSSWNVIAKMTNGGFFTTPNQPFASLGLTSDFSSAGSTIVWQQAHYNVGNYYNTGTGVFTCPVAGKYLVSIMCMSSGDQTLDIELRINGATSNTLVPYQAGTGGFYNQVSGMTMLSLQANDTIAFKLNSGVVYGTAAAGRHSAVVFALMG